MSAKQAKDAEKARRKSESDAERQREFDTALYNSERYRDITQDADFMNMARRADEKLDEQRGIDEARGAMYGETTAANLAAADKRQKAYTDSIADMAANIAARRDGQTARYQDAMNKYFGAVNANNLNNQKSAMDASAASAQASANAFATAGAAAGEGIGAYKANVAAGKNGWTGKEP